MASQLNIKLTLEDLNKVLESLGKEPYIEVFQIIQIIQQQAQEQLRAQENGEVNEKNQIINTE